eukprot:13914211-Heterocapsa_arctica.AAC.1
MIVDRRQPICERSRVADCRDSFATAVKSSLLTGSRRGGARSRGSLLAPLLRSDAGCVVRLAAAVASIQVSIVGRSTTVR